MFTGTLRFNLDPENKCKDEEIENLLRESHLDNLIDNDIDGLYLKI